MVGKDSNTLNRGSMAYDAIHEAVLVLDLPFILQAQYITRLQNWDYIIVSAPEVDHSITKESLWPEDETSTLNHKKSFGLITQNNFKKKFLLLLIVNDCKQLNATLKRYWVRNI